MNVEVTRLLLGLLVGVVAIRLVVVLFDQVQLFRAARREVKRVISEPRQQPSALRRTLGAPSEEAVLLFDYKAPELNLALEAINTIKRQQEEHQRWTALYRAFIAMQYEQALQMHLPFPETISSTRSHNEGKGQSDFQVRYEPRLARKDQPEDQSIPLDADTIARVEEYLRSMRERRGQRA